MRLDAHTTRIVAPNPGAMTLDGTNTYLVGAPGAGEVVCVDPGPLVEEHRHAVEAAAAALEARIVTVVLTHHHRDHAGAAEWAGRWGVPLRAADPELIRAPAEALGDGELVGAGGLLEAIATPGHTSDHLCLRVRETGAVLTGDHVLGRGTSAVLWPDGDLRAYLVSLDRLAALDPPVLYPGHGPVVERPSELLQQYRKRRLEREAQILDLLREGPRSPGALVEQIYTTIDPRLRRAAERSVRAHLAMLVEDGRVHVDGERYAT